MKIQVIVGGQAGSEAKGAVAGHLAGRQIGPMICVRVGGPNAGHTVVNPRTGTRHPLRQIPVGAVTNPNAALAIGAGSEIDLQVLYAEIDALEADGIVVRSRLTIDPSATILTDAHKKVEAELDMHRTIGSTAKGIGAARADRIMRQAKTIGDAPETVSDYGTVEDVATTILDDPNRVVQLEGTQGYQLGLHTENYPQVTSGDCTALDVMAAARVNPFWVASLDDIQVWLVFRPYPIRVAGNSGPLPYETTWEDLGLPQEVTTVTKKVRRVGGWSRDWAQEAIRANTGLYHMRKQLRLALTMADQLDPAIAGATSGEQLAKSEAYQRFMVRFLRDCGASPAMVTTSDRTYVWSGDLK